MKPVDDLSRSLVPFDQESAVVAVIELSNASWLVAGTLPGVARRPLKKLEPDPAALDQLLTRWRIEAETAGRQIGRMIVAYEAGMDSGWRGGCKPEASRPTSSIRPAWRYRESIAAQKPTGWTPPC
jgi:transposase